MNDVRRSFGTLMGRSEGRLSLTSHCGWLSTFEVPTLLGVARVLTYRPTPPRLAKVNRSGPIHSKYSSRTEKASLKKCCNSIPDQVAYHAYPDTRRDLLQGLAYSVNCFYHSEDRAMADHFISAENIFQRC